MSFILDYFSYEVKKTYEDPREREQVFAKQIDTAQEAQADMRTFADMNARPKYQYEHLRMNPYYEQRNRMFPHRRYVRRDGSEQ